MTLKRVVTLTHIWWPWPLTSTLRYLVWHWLGIGYPWSVIVSKTLCDLEKRNWPWRGYHSSDLLGLCQVWWQSADLFGRQLLIKPFVTLRNMFDLDQVAFYAHSQTWWGFPKKNGCNKVPNIGIFVGFWDQGGVWFGHLLSKLCI